ncbi:MAG: ribosomal RNA small subunit methyltransferase A [Saprospiraceae bacterium]|nr:ribosomal RNA small subunit methyltransferase A [Saprospiraceae bacterium]
MSYHAKKSYGQHFLIQSTMIEKIAKLILSFSSKNVLEIGPGKAALTKEIISHIPEFLAVEADKDMISFLENLFPDKKNNFIAADFLKLNIESLFNGEEFLLCGNFPYNISSQIVFKALDNIERIPVLIGMFQKEMAQRIVSPPGSKDYGVISAITALYYSGKLEFDIGPSNFQPAPKVMSSILVLKRNENIISIQERKRVRTLIKTSFLHRRKTLRNNLKSILIDKSILDEPYYNQRAEEISPMEYLRLSRELNF